MLVKVTLAVSGKRSVVKPSLLWARLPRASLWTGSLCGHASSSGHVAVRDVQPPLGGEPASCVLSTRARVGVGTAGPHLNHVGLEAAGNLSL